MAKQCKQLYHKERERLINIPINFEDLFDVTLVTWKNALVDLEIKYDKTPVLSEPYQVPWAYETMFRKEVKILVTLGVIKE